MRLLIVTQKVDKNDNNLGSFHRWVEEFAKYADKVLVICSFLGEHNLPVNVEIISLGKERGANRLQRIGRYLLFFWRYSRGTDAVFFHMIPEFVITSWPISFFRRKSSALWYVHKSVTWRLKLAERLVDWVFTASSLSFRLPSKKVIYTGHAIDTETFKPATSYQPQATSLRLITVGRISPVKDIETIIRACSVLKKTWSREWSLSVIGGPLMQRDVHYIESLKNMVRGEGLGDRIHFEGSRPFGEISQLYREHDIFISMSTTGSIDKSVLEAMASGITVITANEAFQSLLPAKYFLEIRSPEFLAERIKALADEARPNTALRNLVVENHSLEKTIGKIVQALISL